MFSWAHVGFEGREWLQGFLFHGRGATADRLKFKSAPIDKTQQNNSVCLYGAVSTSPVCVCGGNIETTEAGPYLFDDDYASLLRF